MRSVLRVCGKRILMDSLFLQLGVLAIRMNMVFKSRIVRNLVSPSSI